MQIRPEMQALAGLAVGVAREGRLSSQIGRYGEYGMDIGTGWQDSVRNAVIYHRI